MDNRMVTSLYSGLFVVYLTTLLADKIANKQRIGNEMEGSGRGLI
jgi:hypothetical protein